MKKKSKILLSIPVLALSASMVLASCNHEQPKPEEPTTEVDKELQTAIDKKVKELEALKETNADNKYTAESVEKYNLEIDGFIEEVKKLKTLDEVKNYEYEFSSQLQEAEVVTKIGTITTTTAEEVIVKGVVVAKSTNGKDVMIDDGTGRINIFFKDKTPAFQFGIGDYIRVAGPVDQWDSYLTFQYADGDVEVTLLDKSNAPKIENEVTEIEPQQVYDIAKKMSDLEDDKEVGVCPATFEYHPLIKVRATFTSGEYTNYNVTVKDKDGKTITIGGGFVNCIETFDFKENNNKEFMFTGYMFSGLSHPKLMVLEAEEVVPDIVYGIDKNTLDLDKTEDFATFKVEKLNNGATLEGVTAEGVTIEKVADKDEWKVTAAKETRGKITVTYKVGEKTEVRDVYVGATHIDETKIRKVATVSELKALKDLERNERFNITGVVKKVEYKDKEGKLKTKFALTTGEGEENQVDIFQYGVCEASLEGVEWTFNAGQAELNKPKGAEFTLKDGDKAEFTATYNTKYKSISGTYTIVE